MKLIRTRKSPYRRINVDGVYSTPRDRPVFQMTLAEASAKITEIASRLLRVETQVARSRLIHSGTLAEMNEFVPYNPGTMFWDETHEELYVWTGSEWLVMNAIWSGTTAEREAFTPIPNRGFYMDTDYDSMYGALNYWGFLTADRVMSFLELEQCKALWTMGNLGVSSYPDVYDVSGGGYHLDNAGGIAMTEGMISYMYFDDAFFGTNRLQLASRYPDVNPDGMDYLAHTAWAVVCRPEDVRNGVMVHKGYHYIVTMSDRKFGYRNNTFGSGTGVYTDVIDADEWYDWNFIFCSQGSANDAKIFHNGNWYTSYAHYSSVGVGASLYIGSAANQTYQYAGDISVVAVYDEEPPAEAVERLYSRVRSIYQI